MVVSETLKRWPDAVIVAWVSWQPVAEGATKVREEDAGPHIHCQSRRGPYYCVMSFGGLLVSAGLAPTGGAQMPSGLHFSSLAFALWITLWVKKWLYSPKCCLVRVLKWIVTTSNHHTPGLEFNHLPWAVTETKAEGGLRSKAEIKERHSKRRWNETRTTTGIQGESQ